MTSLRHLHEQLKDVIGRVVGGRHEMPTVFRTQVQSVGYVGDIKALPITPSDPIQIADPGDPNFGKFYFMAGFSAIGGPDPMP